MSNDEGLFSGRFWLPGLVVGIVIFVVLSAFFGYQQWQMVKGDHPSAQKIRDLQPLSSNLLLFSRQIVTGEKEPIDTFAATIETMDEIISRLQSAGINNNQSTAGEYESVIGAWSSIKSNASVLFNLDGSLDAVNLVSANLETSATEAQVLASGTLEKMINKDATKEQMVALNAQVILLRQMSNDMQRFVNEPQSTSQSFDNYRSKLFDFKNNHQALLQGDASKRIRALRSEDIRAEVEAINELTERTSVSEADLFAAVEALMQARDAQSKIVLSLEGMQLSLEAIAQDIDKNKVSPVGTPLWLIISLSGLVVCFVALLFAMRQSSQKVSEIEQSETENVQAAILRLLDELADLADGDLTVTTTVSEDFTGAIADSVNYTIDQLRQLVSRINNTAVRVSGAAQDSQQTALHLAEASDHQAQEIAGASAAINEMAVTIDQVSANAAESALVASKSVSIANNGSKLVQNTIHGMDTIREQIQDTSKRIKRLGESSQEIGDIVSLINDIADQTNILALNAAIQASMAGDAGRGFAVVADEVQRLAERSAAATKQIEGLVKTIQSDTNEAVISMEQTTTQVVSGARLAQDAGVALEEIEGVSANIAELIQNISNAARQQASSAGHISNTMNVIQEITSQTSAGTGATAQAIGDLADMALELRESVAGFKLPESMDAGDDDFDASDASWSASDNEMVVSDSTLDDIDFDGELNIADFDSDIVDEVNKLDIPDNFSLDNNADNELLALFDNDEGLAESELDFVHSGADLEDSEGFDFVDSAYESPTETPVSKESLTAEELAMPLKLKPIPEEYRNVKLTDDDFDLTGFEFKDDAKASETNR